MKHYLSGEMVLKEAWDAEHNAIKMIPAVGTETSIEISHQDGDSISSVGVSMTLTEGVHDITGMREMCVFGSAAIELSPIVDGNEFYSIVCTPLEVKTICAMRIRIIGTGKVVVRG